MQRIIALAEELAPIVANAQGRLSGSEERPASASGAAQFDAPSRSGGEATRVSENELVKQAKRAALLAKADLQSAMVYEIPEMQGRIGRIYAEIAGEDPSVALAIEEHYKPLGPTDDVPTDPVSVTVALAEKLDTLVGFWAIDEKPTGSKDPFALRRAALGVIRLVVENGVRLPLYVSWHWAWLNIFRQIEGERTSSLVEAIYALDKQLRASTVDELVEKVTDDQRSFVWEKAPIWAEDLSSKEKDLLSFFHDRLKVFLKDEGIRHDVLDAVLSYGTLAAEEAAAPEGAPSRSRGGATGVSENTDDLLLITQKARALQKLVDTDDGENLIQGYKRAANILAAEEKKGAVIAEAINADLFESDEERALFNTLENVEKLAANAIEAENFEEAMSRLASLRAPIDNFFEHVHVNADDESVRANRLALLSRIRAATATVADLSKISG